MYIPIKLFKESLKYSFMCFTLKVGNYFNSANVYEAYEYRGSGGKRSQELY